MNTNKLLPSTLGSSPLVVHDSDSLAMQAVQNRRETWEKTGFHKGFYFKDNDNKLIFESLPIQLEKSTDARFKIIFGNSPDRITRQALPLLFKCLSLIKNEEEGMRLAREENNMAMKTSEFSRLSKKYSLNITQLGHDTYMVDAPIPKIETPRGFAYLMRFIQGSTERKNSNSQPVIASWANVVESQRTELEISLKSDSSEERQIAQVLLLILDYEKVTKNYTFVMQQSVMHIRSFMDTHANEKQFPYLTTIAPFHTRLAALMASLITQKNNMVKPPTFSTHMDEITQNYYVSCNKLDKVYISDSSQKKLTALIYQTTFSLLETWKNTDKVKERLTYRCELSKYKPEEKPLVEKKPVKIDKELLVSSKPKKAPLKKPSQHDVIEDIIEEPVVIPKKIEVCKEENIESVPFEFFARPPIRYLKRVKRWENATVEEIQKFPDYRDIKDLAYLKKIKIFHDFSSYVDELAFTPGFFRLIGDCRHLIAAFEFPNGTLDTGIITYHFVDKDHEICDHRFHHRVAPNEFLNLDLNTVTKTLSQNKQDLNQEKYVAYSKDNCKDTCTENKKHGFITIDDKGNNVLIHIFPTKL